MSLTSNPKKMLADVLDNLGVSKYRVSTFPQNVLLEKCNDERGLLPNWMFRTDMISAMLLGTRVFNAVYLRNDDAISYLSYVDFEEAVLGMAEKESYLNFPFKEDLPNSMGILMTSLAVTESLDIDHEKKEVMIKSVVGFFNMPGNGQTLGFPNIQVIEAHRFHDMLQAVRPLMRLENNKTIDLNLQG